MTAHSLSVFVSSRVYELVDLRSAVRAFLEDLGVRVMMSDEIDFPDDGRGTANPYVACLDTVESCELVIVVLDRTYGHAFSDWSPKAQYDGLAPTHAELRHATALGKRVLIFVRESTMTHYETWRHAPEAYAKKTPSLPEHALLDLVREIRTNTTPTPWVYPFRNAAHLIEGLRGAFVNELYSGLRAREEAAQATARTLAEQITAVSPEVRAEIESHLSPAWASERDRLTVERDAAVARVALLEQAENRAAAADERVVESRAALAAAERKLARSEDVLAAAVARDVGWLTLVRTRLMPPRPGRVPFHNDREVAVRGFRVGDWPAPVLREVTWARVPRHEGGLDRGFDGAIVLHGKNFAPGIVYERRGLGHGEHVFRHVPRIYFGEHLEIPTGVQGDGEDGLSWRGCEFRVVNPDGKASDWMAFSYRWDDDALVATYRQLSAEGAALLSAGRARESVEPLRKARVFADRLPMVPPDDKETARELHDRAIDAAQLERLRFRPGDRVRVLKGPYAGRTARVREIARRHHHAYHIDPDDDLGSLEGHGQVADDEVEAVS